ncbi:hypothetical protein [Pseudomonas faucium]|uniref:hypothetical protein n=1 Tax=Pseudomonas faucium TaxID=2740518 RepID=UPI0039C4235F
MCAITYIALRHLDEIESSLSNCKMVRDNKLAYSATGILGKLMRIGMISFSLIAPNLCARRGLIDLNDFQNMPPRLKKPLIATWYILCALLLALACFRALLYFTLN